MFTESISLPSSKMVKEVAKWERIREGEGVEKWPGKKGMKNWSEKGREKGSEVGI